MKKLLLSIMALLMSVCMFADDVVFDFDNDYKQLFPSIGESSNDSHDGDFTDVTTATIGDISFTVTPAESGTANRIWGSSPRLRLYSGTFTIESAGEPITYIKFTGNTNWNVTVDNGTLSGKEWAGNSNKIIFTVSKNTQIGQVEVSTEEGHVLKESLYSIAFTASQDGWSIDDKNLGGLTYVWKPSSSYGYVATAYTDACYETESWLLSPVFDMSKASQIEMTISHAGNKFAGAVSDQVSFCATTDGGENWKNVEVAQWPAGNNWNFNESAVDISEYAGQEAVQLAIVYKSTTSSAGSYEIRSMEIFGKGAITIKKEEMAGPTITPATGTYDTDQTVTIVDPTGNNYTIYYTLDGSEPTETSSIYEAPFTVTETTTVKAVYVDDDDNMSAVSMSVITISKKAVYTTIAELIENCTTSGSNNAPVVTLKTTNLLVTGVNGSNVFVSDETGAFLFYGSNSGLTKGDIISGSVEGKLYSYNGLPEISVSDKWASVTVVSQGNIVKATKVAAADITAADANKYVRFEGLEYKSEETVSNKTNFTLTDGTTDVVIRDNFSNLTDVFKVGGKYNVNVFVIPFKETIQYYVVSTDDVEDALGVAEDVNSDGIIDTQDVLAVYDAIQSSSNDSRYDVNGDTIIDTQDVLAIYEKIRNQ